MVFKNAQASPRASDEEHFRGVYFLIICLQLELHGVPFYINKDASISNFWASGNYVL